MKAKISLIHQTFFKFSLIPLIAILLFCCNTSTDNGSESNLSVKFFNGNTEIGSAVFALEKTNGNFKYISLSQKPATKIKIGTNLGAPRLNITIRTYAKNNYLLNSYPFSTPNNGIQTITTNNPTTPLEYAMVDIK